VAELSAEIEEAMQESREPVRIEIVYEPAPGE
jgi:hypothetical protein